MFAVERRQRILELVRSSGAISLRELARQLATSEVTVRRDLRMLEGEGLLDRRHGGAVLRGGLSHEPTYTEKSHVAAAQKAAIAELAATLVGDGDALVVGAGTTTQAFARRLTRFTELTVVTNSLLVAAALVHARSVDVVVTGGSLRGSIHALVGSTAEQALGAVRSTRTFLSGNGLTAARGLSTPNVNVAGIDRALAAAAREVVVLADHTKIGVDAMMQTVPADRIDHLVTDELADPAEVAALRELGVQVHVATVGDAPRDGRGPGEDTRDAVSTAP